MSDIVDCETCKDLFFILSNDVNNRPDLQKCDECNFFKSDDDAKKYVLKFILKRGNNGKPHTIKSI